MRDLLNLAGLQIHPERLDLADVVVNDRLEDFGINERLYLLEGLTEMSADCPRRRRPSFYSKRNNQPNEGLLQRYRPMLETAMRLRNGEAIRARIKISSHLVRTIGS